MVFGKKKEKKLAQGNLWDLGYRCAGAGPPVEGRGAETRTSSRRALAGVGGEQAPTGLVIADSGKLRNGEGSSEMERDPPKWRVGVVNVKMKSGSELGDNW